MVYCGLVAIGIIVLTRFLYHYNIDFLVGHQLSAEYLKGTHYTWYLHHTDDGERHVYVYLNARSDDGVLRYAEMARVNEPVVAEVIFTINNKEDIANMWETIERYAQALQNGRYPSDEVRFIAKNDFDVHNPGVADILTSHGIFGINAYSFVFPFISILYIAMSALTKGGLGGTLKQNALSVVLMTAIACGLPILGENALISTKFDLLHTRHVVQYIESPTQY
ncbi:hypothetical protein BFV94_4576 [Alteromonas macleodii]|uniref:Uncharacterized protein n=1 Tax=Alteromonas macleodii TaxID=28108 RepID=A0AB36FN02_ALTMA|nr:hypothetical protein BFV95_4586 [Alteromonas macleodii]OES25105.1 hypothetical protein BFV94_4576 [Alteromonas macleodii]OES39148.1 hypothetical protein BFV96_4296 [Alteromonas macleodii]